MATLYEHVKSRKLTVSAKDPKVTLLYTAAEAGDSSDVEAAVYSQSPDAFESLSRLDWNADPLGGDLWTVEVYYGVPTSENPALTTEAGTAVPIGNQTQLEPPAPFDGQGDAGDPPDNGDAPSQNATENDKLGPEWSFQTGGSTVHITQSLTTISKTRRTGGVSQDYKRAIGVGGDGDVKGTDIISRQMNFTYVGNFKFITQQYLKDLCDLTGKVNSDPWFIYDTGEVLFLGADGNYKSGEGWTITFHFAFSPNKVAIEICDGLTVAEKKGHEYLWCTYKPSPTTGGTVELPESAYVEKVYELGDLTKLGI